MSRKRTAKRNAGRESAAPEAGQTPRPLRPSRWTLRLGILLVAGGGLLAWYLNHRAKDGLTIENQTGQTITTLVVIADGKTSTFSKVGPGASVFAPFGPKTAEQDAAALAANTWSLLAQTQCRQPLAAGPAAYFLDTAELARTAKISTNDLYSIAVEFPGKMLRSVGKIGDRRKVVILPTGEFRLQ